MKKIILLIICMGILGLVEGARYPEPVIPNCSYGDPIFDDSFLGGWRCPVKTIQPYPEPKISEPICIEETCPNADQSACRCTKMKYPEDYNWAINLNNNLDSVAAGRVSLTGGEGVTEKEITEKIQKRIEPKNDFDINDFTEEELDKLNEKLEQRKLINAINSCGGYYLYETCYLTGESFDMVGESYFVEGKHFYLKKEINESCNQSYECETGLCSNYICSLPYEPKILRNETNNESGNSLITGSVVGNKEPNWLEKVLIKLFKWFR